jgi:hypothetical protein
MSETRKYLPPVHTSVETAFVQDGYPFGYRGKCLRRVWIETTKKGQRFVYQTSQPYYPESGETAEKVRNGRWNKPKASTYSECLVLYTDENDHVHTDGVSVNAEAAQFAAFRERAKDALDAAGLKRVETAEKVTAAISALWKKRLEEQAQQPHLTASQLVDKQIAELGSA